MIIEPQFNGPPHSAHGGYVCGRLAEQLDRPAEVTLGRPRLHQRLGDYRLQLAQHSARPDGRRVLRPPENRGASRRTRLAAFEVVGRRRMAASVLYTESGELVGVAEATWVELKKE